MFISDLQIDVGVKYIMNIKTFKMYHGIIDHIAKNRPRYNKTTKQ